MVSVVVLDADEEPGWTGNEDFPCCPLLVFSVVCCHHWECCCRCYCSTKRGEEEVDVAAAAGPVVAMAAATAACLDYQHTLNMTIPQFFFKWESFPNMWEGATTILIGKNKVNGLKVKETHHDLKHVALTSASPGPCQQPIRCLEQSLQVRHLAKGERIAVTQRACCILPACLASQECLPNTCVRKRLTKKGPEPMGEDPDMELGERAFTRLRHLLPDHLKEVWEQHERDLPSLCRRTWL